MVIEKVTKVHWAFLEIVGLCDTQFVKIKFGSFTYLLGVTSTSRLE
jgi:hypothetical protein